jgi:hypothetical protein
MSDRQKAAQKGIRDAQGRFLEGCPAGPGRPAGTREHRTQMVDAIAPSDVGRILQTLRDLALAGDVGAAKLVLDRIVGKSREAAPDMAIEFGDLSSSEDIVRAVHAVVRAVGAGHLPSADGKQIVDLLSACIEVGEVSAALEQVEALTWQRG